MMCCLSSKLIMMFVQQVYDVLLVQQADDVLLVQLADDVVACSAN